MLYLGKELLVSTNGYVCRLCNCFLLDEQRVSIHCQTAAHYINYTTMTKMKEATLVGKKRGIDQVIEKDDTAKQGEVEVKEEKVDIDSEVCNTKYIYVYIYCFVILMTTEQLDQGHYCSRIFVYYIVQYTYSICL